MEGDPNPPPTAAPLEPDNFSVLKEIYTHVHKEMMDFRVAGLRSAVIYTTFVTVFVSWLVSERKGHGNNFSLGLLGLGVTIFMLAYFYRVEIFFRDAAEVINKIEKLWGGFTENRFGSEKDLESLWKSHERKTILLPKRWEVFGTNKWGEPIFQYTKILLVVMIIIFFLLMLSALPVTGPLVQAVFGELFSPR